MGPLVLFYLLIDNADIPILEPQCDVEVNDVYYIMTRTWDFLGIEPILSGVEN